MAQKCMAATHKCMVTHECTEMRKCMATQKCTVPDECTIIRKPWKCMAKQNCTVTVYEQAKVYGNAEVYGNSRVCGEAEIFGNAHVNLSSGDDCKIRGNAKIFGEMEITSGVYDGDREYTRDAKIFKEMYDGFYEDFKTECDLDDRDAREWALELVQGNGAWLPQVLKSCSNIKGKIIQTVMPQAGISFLRWQVPFPGCAPRIWNFSKPTSQYIGDWRSLLRKEMQGPRSGRTRPPLVEGGRLVSGLADRLTESVLA